MSRAIRPMEFLVVAVAGWLNRDPQKVVDYLCMANSKLGGDWCLENAGAM
ncbi:hypothetical protein ACFLQ0_00225 [Nitrospinota bacterium]